MANLAARMGLETTGINLPLATPIDSATVRDVRTQAVIAGDAALSQEVERKLRRRTPPRRNRKRRWRRRRGIAHRRQCLRPPRGRLARGDETGQAAALDLLAGHFPNLWEQGKQHLSLEEIRYDLHRFFSQQLQRRAGRAGTLSLESLDEALSKPRASKT